jgi:hypothetical protein
MPTFFGYQNDLAMRNTADVTGGDAVVRMLLVVVVDWGDIHVFA